jgi:hypothetical protein
MEELYKKIDIVLKSKFPNEEERDEMVQKAGQIVWLETMNQVLELLPGDRERQKFSSLMKNGEVEDAIDYCAKLPKKIFVEDIFEDRAKSIVLELFG